MSNHHDKKPKRVCEPVQVYLAIDEQQMLARLVSHLDLSKSDVVRRALSALEREAFDPTRHPALRLIGVAEQDPEAFGQGDPALQHDRYLAEEAEGRRPPPKRGKRRGR